MKISTIRGLFGVVFCVLTITYIVSTLLVFEKRRLMKSVTSSNQVVNREREIRTNETQTLQQKRIKSPTLDFSYCVIEPRTHPCCQASLKGLLDVDINRAENAYWRDLGISKPENGSFLGDFTRFDNTSDVSVAIFHGPRYSTAVQRIAIIVPFRDREHHLRVFLGHLLPVLQRQGNIFSIFVVEQFGNDTFNKGRVMNSGFKYALSVGDKMNDSFDCFIFHDVDMLVENDNLIYRCSKDKIVVHLSTSISKFNYNTLCCGMTVGGAIGLTAEQYKTVNGFPNSLWGWGGEDDALNGRIKNKGLTISRPTPDLGRFTMMVHERDKLNPYNNGVHSAVRTSIRKTDEDGFSNLNTEVVAIEKYATYVKVLVDVGKP